MAKVYAFPVKPQLTQEIEECLYGIANTYVKTMNYALTELSSEHSTDAELKGIIDLVVLTFANGLEKAIDELEP
jgi:hypothetical protein